MYTQEIKIILVGLSGAVASAVIDTSKKFADVANDDVYNVARFIPIIASVGYIVWKILRDVKGKR